MRLYTPFIITLVASVATPVCGAPLPTYEHEPLFSHYSRPVAAHETRGVASLLGKVFKPATVEKIMKANLPTKLGAGVLAGAIGAGAYTLTTKPLKWFFNMNSEEETDSSTDSESTSSSDLRKRGEGQGDWDDLTYAQKLGIANQVTSAVASYESGKLDPSKLGLSEEDIKTIAEAINEHPEGQETLSAAIVDAMDQIQASGSSTALTHAKRGILSGLLTTVKSIGTKKLLKEGAIGVAGGAAVVGLFGLFNHALGGSKDKSGTTSGSETDPDLRKRGVMSSFSKLLKPSTFSGIYKTVGNWLMTPTAEATIKNGVTKLADTPAQMAVKAALGSVAMGAGGLALVGLAHGTKAEDYVDASAVKKRSLTFKSEREGAEHSLEARRLDLFKIGAGLLTAGAGLGAVLGANWAVDKALSPFFSGNRSDKKKTSSSSKASTSSSESEDLD